MRQRWCIKQQWLLRLWMIVYKVNMGRHNLNCVDWHIHGGVYYIWCTVCHILVLTGKGADYWKCGCHGGKAWVGPTSLWCIPSLASRSLIWSSWPATMSSRDCIFLLSSLSLWARKTENRNRTEKNRRPNRIIPKPNNSVPVRFQVLGNRIYRGKFGFLPRFTEYLFWYRIWPMIRSKSINIQ
jgi:hypothetical protein